MCTPMIQLVSFFSPRSLEWPLGKILRPMSHRMDMGVRREIINLDPLDDRFHYVRRVSPVARVWLSATNARAHLKNSGTIKL